MKLSSINSINHNNRSINNNNNKNNNQSVNFKGVNVAEGLVHFWQFVDNGGRALQFTVEDMTGTNIPRSIKGAKAGSELTGKVNIPALLQEALREFLTGPTMCVMPVVILNAAIKLTGKTANTHSENIRNLSYLMEQTKPAAGQNLDKAFFETTVTDMLQKTTGKQEIKKEYVDKLVKGIENYKNTGDKKQSKKLLSELQKTFENIVKETKDDYKGTNFLHAKYSISGSKEGATSFKNYVGYITSYAEDFAKKFGTDAKGVTSENIASFKSSWLGKRALTVLGMVFITGVLMTQIPKIYTKASGKVNPNASAIYDEAQGKTQKPQQEEQKKEVK